MERIFKKDIVPKIAERKGCTKQDAAKFYDTFMEVIQDELLQGNSVSLNGIGSIQPRIHKGQKVNFKEKTDSDEYVFLKLTTVDNFKIKLREKPDLIDKLKPSDTAVPPEWIINIFNNAINSMTEREENYYENNRNQNEQILHGGYTESDNVRHT